jgi:hypothetical protein
MGSDGEAADGIHTDGYASDSDVSHSQAARCPEKAEGHASEADQSQADSSDGNDSSGKASYGDNPDRDIADRDKSLCGFKSSPESRSVDDVNQRHPEDGQWGFVLVAVGDPGSTFLPNGIGWLHRISTVGAGEGLVTDGSLTFRATDQSHGISSLIDPGWVLWFAFFAYADSPIIPEFYFILGVNANHVIA